MNQEKKENIKLEYLGQVLIGMKGDINKLSRKCIKTVGKWIKKLDKLKENSKVVRQEMIGIIGNLK